MMPSSLPMHAAPPGTAARTVRELRTSDPASIDERWCRQLAGDLLRTVENQQALRQPHRIIMPDSVLVRADGAATILPAADDEDEAPLQPPVTVDLKAIATVLHFAISGESPPAAALLGRQLPDWSADLLGAIDACLYGDRHSRPASIEAMRALFGLQAEAPTSVAVDAPAAAAPLALAPAPATAADELEQALAGLAAAVEEADAAPARPAPTAPSTVAPPTVAAAAAVAMPPAVPMRKSALLPALAAALVALALVGYGAYQKGRQDGAEAVLASVPAAPALAPTATAPAIVPAAVPAAPLEAAASAPLAAVAPPPASVAAPAPMAPSATYKLSIKPWGTIYVDGVKRGVSPPLKTLTLTGPHTIRIDNPNFPSRQITVQPGDDTTTRITHEFH